MAKVLDAAKLLIGLAETRANASQGDPMTNLRLQKLLYFAQGWHLARHDRPLFEEEMQAWKLGPVVPEVYEAYRAYGNGGLHSAVPKEDVFLPEEFETLLDVYSQYSDFSTSKLVDMTHEANTPWQIAFSSGGVGSIIQKNAVKEYFQAQDKKLLTVDDLLEGMPVEVVE